MTGWLRFESPGYLALLAVLPFVVVLALRSMSGLGPIRRALAIGLRCLVIVLIVLALAGAQSTKSTDKLAVVFLVDRSSSIPAEQQQRAFDFIRDSERGRRPDDRLGVIAFDGVSAVEQLPMGTLALTNITEPIQPDQTDIGAAARLALALLPSDAARRVVLLSDGNENVGQILDEARQFNAAGVPIDVVPLTYELKDEIVFESLAAPPNASLEQTVRLRATIRSQKATTGQIRLKRNDAYLDLDPNGPGTGRAVQLHAGANRIDFEVPLRSEGLHRYEAVFEPDDSTADTIAANNASQAFTLVAGQGKVLLIASEESLAQSSPSAQFIRSALEREKLECEIVPAGTPFDQDTLLSYAAVILDNVSAGAFTDEQKRTLATYVRDLAGGLIMIGGDESFGAGGWMGSPVEEVMPVSFDVQNIKQIQKGALCLVMHACEVPDGNYIGERCAIEAVKALSSRDLIGVLAYGWGSAANLRHWVVPLQEVGQKTPIIQKIKQMQMGDMPDLDEVMRPGVEALVADQTAAQKHMIVISDFDPSAPRSDLMATLKQHKITVSTVAIGYGGHFIDEPKARDIAVSTGGKFYRTNKFSELPQIFIKESQIVRRSLIQEETFTPAFVNAGSPIMAGMFDDGIPHLGGLVLTTRKPAATVPLIRKSSDGDDPVLAHWQVGSGKAVAFTSGMWPQWGRDWTSWEKFSKFWAQVIRWVSRPPDSTAFDVKMPIVGSKGKIQIEALDKNAAAINFMSVDGTLVAPGERGEPVRLKQIAPGRYEAEFDARRRGNYIFQLRYTIGTGDNARSGLLRTGVSAAYSPEYSRLESNLALLEDVRALTNGRQLDSARPAAAFDRTGVARAQTRQTIWEDLVRTMLLLFLLDVAIRRIAINPVEVARKLRQFLAEIAGRGRSAESQAVLSTLKGARERVREEKLAPGSDAAVGEAGRPPDRAAKYDAPAPPSKATEDLSKALGGASEQDAPVVAKPTGKKPAISEGDYTSRLLKAKRKIRDDLDQPEEPDQ